MVTRFRSTGEKGKPHSTEEGRSAEAQRAYMRKFGPQEPRRKTLAVTDKYKEIREILKDPAGFKPLRRANRARGGLGAALRGGGRAFNKGGKVK